MRFGQRPYRFPVRTLVLLLLGIFPIPVIPTPYYYAEYKSYGTGDTVITTTHLNGPIQPANRKWQVECFDGEAVVGISDNIWDFTALTYVWCKFMFPFKPPSQGLYPYYKNCHMRDYKYQFTCYEKANHTSTVNGFITGFSDTDYVFWLFTPTDVFEPYKCCQTPPGYYIDYLSCYYLVTHDLYWEFYDGNFFLINCATGYVATGVGTKKNPINTDNHIEWLQCCRLGWGAPIGLSPPVIYAKGRPPAYTSSSNVSPIQIPPSYQHQYRKKRSVANDVTHVSNTSLFREKGLEGDEEEGKYEGQMRQRYRPMNPAEFLITDHDVPVSIRDHQDPFWNGEIEGMQQ